MYLAISHTILFIPNNKCFTGYRSDTTLLHWYQLCRYFDSVFPISCLRKIPLYGVAGSIRLIRNYTSSLKHLIISPINSGWYILRVILMMSNKVLHLINDSIYLMPLVTYYLLMCYSVSFSYGSSLTSRVL